MSNVSVKIDAVSFGEALAALQIIVRSVPGHAIDAIRQNAKQTHETIVSETVKILNVAEARVESEINTTAPDTDDLGGYKAEIVSTGIPIELVDFATDANTWKRKKPVHVKIFRDGTTYEFRHVRVGRGQIYHFLPYVRGQAIKRRILSSVRIQDIQAQDYFINPIIEGCADKIVEDFGAATGEVLANV